MRQTLHFPLFMAALGMALRPMAPVPLHTVGVRAGCDTDVVQVLGGQCRGSHRAMSVGFLSWQPPKGPSVKERCQSHPSHKEVPPLQALPMGHCSPGQSSGPEWGGGPDAPVVPQGAARALLPTLGNHVELPINPAMAAMVLHHHLQASVASKDRGW